MGNIKKSWKSGLLSSSVPLEYEAAKILTSEAFAVSADYAYLRKDEEGFEKEFSCDIGAMAFCPFNNPNKISLVFNLLVECKYRNPNIAWLFLPDPNKSDFSCGTLGSTLRVIDKFSYAFLDTKPIQNLEARMDWCFKGVEINLDDGNVHDAELKRGISQLQYGLPSLIASGIQNSILCHDVDNTPFALAPLLLTTAPLYVAKRKFSVKNVKQSGKLSDIAKPVNALILNIDTGPALKVYCQKIFREVGPLQDYTNLKSIQDFRKKGGEYEHLLPSNYINALMNGFSPTANIFSQLFVVNISIFKEFIRDLKRSVAKTSRRRRLKKVNSFPKSSMTGN